MYRKIKAQYEKLYAGDKPAVVVVTNVADPGFVSEPLDFRKLDLSDIRVHHRLWDHTYDQLTSLMEYRRGVEDGWTPCLSFGYGFGYFGAVFCDAAVTFTDTTSYIDHTGLMPDEITDEILNKDRFWRDMMLEQAEYFVRKGAGEFLVDPYPNPSPLDMVNMFRGNDLFTDFYEFPEELKALLDRCADASIRFNRQLNAAKANVKAPGASAFGRWYPSGICMLEDAADLCSPATYLEFGAPYTQKVLSALDGGYLHHHSLGKQQFKNMGALKKLWIEQISSDPGVARPASYLKELQEMNIGAVLDLEVTPQEIYENIDLFTRGRYILEVSDELSLDDARRLVDFVYSKT